MNVTYSGSVQIKIKQRPPLKTHNSGTKCLFTFLLNVLSNSFTPTSQEYISKNLPTYMGMVAGVDKTNFDTTLDYKSYENYSILNTKLGITSRVVSEGSDGASPTLTVSSALIHSQVLSGIPLSGNAYLLLIDGENRILAYSEFGIEDIRSIVEDVTGQALIDWTMSFSNSKTGDNK